MIPMPDEEGRVPPRPEHITGPAPDCPHCLHALLYKSDEGEPVTVPEARRIARFMEFDVNKRAEMYWAAYSVAERWKD